MNQIIIWGVLVQGIAAAMGLLVLYFVIKAAVREGIKESGLLEAQRRVGRDPAIGDTRPNMPGDLFARR